MLDNCRAYNGPDSAWGLYADAFQLAAARMLQLSRAGEGASFFFLGGGSKKKGTGRNENPLTQFLKNKKNETRGHRPAREDRQPFRPQAGRRRKRRRGRGRRRRRRALFPPRCEPHRRRRGARRERARGARGAGRARSGGGDRGGGSVFLRRPRPKHGPRWRRAAAVPAGRRRGRPGRPASQVSIFFFLASSSHEAREKKRGNLTLFLLTPLETNFQNTGSTTTATGSSGASQTRGRATRRGSEGSEARPLPLLLLLRRRRRRVRRRARARAPTAGRAGTASTSAATASRPRPAGWRGATTATGTPFSALSRSCRLTSARRPRTRTRGRWRGSPRGSGAKRGRGRWRRRRRRCRRAAEPGGSRASPGPRPFRRAGRRRCRCRRRCRWLENFGKRKRYLASRGGGVVWCAIL